MSDIQRALDTITLGKGAHANSDAGMCAMEAVAWLANEPHSDHPVCASPVIAAYVRSLNDYMPTKQRQKLKALLPRIIGSANPALDRERANILAWASITVFAPTALHACGLVDHAETLRKLDKYDWTGAQSAAAAANAAADVTAARSSRLMARAADAADAAWAAVAAANEAAYVTAAYVTAADAARTAAMDANVWDLAIDALKQALEVKCE